MNSTPPQDYSTLNWVREQIAETLKQVRHTLEAYVEDPREKGEMESCAGYLHQVRGALRMLELHGATLLVEEMECIADALLKDGVRRKDDCYGLLMQSILQLPTYLERLNSGCQDSALAFFPLINGMRALRGASPLTEDTEFHPDLALYPPPLLSKDLPGSEDTRLALVRKLRPQYQMALVSWYRDPGSLAHLGHIASIIKQLEQVSHSNAGAQLWWITGGLIEAVMEGGLTIGASVKLLLGQVDRQIKRLIEEGEQAWLASPPKELLQNLLYCVARAQPLGRRVVEIKQTYQLDTLLPDDVHPSLEALTGPDLESLRSVSAAIKEDLSRAKDGLDSFARGDKRFSADLQPVVDILREIAATLSMLGLGASQQTIQQQSSLIEAMVRGKVALDDDGLMDIAWALLSVESSLDQFELQGRGTAIPADGARAVEQWAAEGREFDDSSSYDAPNETLRRQLLRSVIKEAQTDMARVKEGITAFIGASDDSQGLPDVPQCMAQIVGGLSMLSKTRAAELLEACRQYIMHGLMQTKAIPDQAQLDLLADAISSIEYYLEALAEGREDSEAILDRAQASVQQLICLHVGAQVPNEPLPLAALGTEFDVLAATVIHIARPDGIDDEIIGIFLEEAEEESLSIAAQLPLWKNNPENSAALALLRRSFHTLKGSGRMVGAIAISEFAWSVENMLNRVIDHTVQASPHIFDLMERAQALLPRLINDFRAGAPSVDVQPLMVQAKLLSQTMGFATSRGATGPPEDQPKTEAVSPDPALLDIFRRESLGHLGAIKDFTDRCQEQPEECRVGEALARTLHTLNGSAAMAGVADIAAVSGLLEKYIRLLSFKRSRMKSEGIQVLRESTLLIGRMIDCLGDPGGARPFDQTGLTMRISALYEAELALQRSDEQDSSDTQVSATPSERNSEIMQGFLEEAREILEASDNILQQWMKEQVDHKPLEKLQRELHTLKGGARMVGLSAVADLSHSLESMVTAVVDGTLKPSPHLPVVMQQTQDRLLQMLDSLATHGLLQPADDLVMLIGELLEEQTAEFEVAPASGLILPFPEHLVASADEETVLAEIAEEELRFRVDEPHGQVRVRADLLDSMVNFAGEISISRSRIEQQIGAFKYNLVEMGQIITRLSDQLRKLDIETETQILFRQAETIGREDGEFDPLEFDRFSHMQQLSRSLLESVGDLSSIEVLLHNLTRESETLLLQQSRVNTDLHQGLLRTRMLKFATLVSRLRRIVRQTCQEVGKQAELYVIGGDAEMDRTMLEKIVPSLEHMLRNAVDHGIEVPAERRAAGKPDLGRITLRLTREGSQMLLQISDDGAGLNLPLVRQKAIECGLLNQGVDVTDSVLTQFILEPGFSTAQQITQVSGRGVGLDVVNSEIKQLNGTLRILSASGKGTSFALRLPLTLSTNQVLLITAGEDIYAIPLTGIERIVHVMREELERLYADDQADYVVDGQHYRLLHFGTVLGRGRPHLSGQQKKLPVLLARAGDQYVALQVEALSGSREIVVKSVGPQLSTVRGITGATILGDGRVVLILDIDALVRIGLMPVSPMPMAPVSQASGVSITAMVVDDSITVRKVTARLLERHNIEVLTAKDGVEAVALLEEHVPDVMLLDIEMPRMDGYELAIHMRNVERLRQVPIIMITSRASDKHRERALRIGVNQYLGKPYQESELLEAIDQQLGGRLYERH